MSAATSSSGSRVHAVRVMGAGAVMLGLIVAAFLPAGCRRTTSRAKAAPAPTARGDRLNVILISIDTLRADRLGCYGYSRDTSPSIDRLAARGVRFKTVVSESPWTAPAHMTLFTGLYPTTHGVTSPGTRVWRGITTLPELLQTQGYRTFAFTGGRNVDASFGFGRGFEKYIVTEKSKGGVKLCALDVAIEKAQEQIEALHADEPYFLFVHGYDVHGPYEPWEPWASKFRSPDAEPFDDYLQESYVMRERGVQLSPGNIRFLSDLYDAGIARTDQILGGFFEFLRRRGELERSLVVLLADHGEEFGEHGWVGHYGRIHPECLRVPMIITGPGLGPAVVEQGVGLKDVMPTLMELVGVPCPNTQGRSLVPLMRGKPGEPWPLFSETDFGARFRSLIWDDHQLIVRAYDPTPVLHDLASDFFGQRNIAETHPERVAELLALMPDPRPGMPVHVPIDAKQIEALEALGYLGSSE